ncbi:hypothetical protein GCM10028784_26760 [Myceligenerans cantabricum]
MGVIGIMLLVVGVVLAAATPVGADVSEQLYCAVSPIVKEDGAQGDCVDGAGDEPGGGDGGGSGDGGSGDDDTEDGPCEETVTMDRVPQEGKYGDDKDRDWDMTVIQIDCVWYPVPVGCVFALSDTELDDLWMEVSAGDPETVDRDEKIVDCVTDGWGDTSDDPDDENCNRTMPTSEDVSLDPPEVRIGCKWLPVPEDVCDEEWEVYKNSEPGKERAAASGWLDECVTTAYDNMEPDCYVKVNTHTESGTVKFLFFRMSSTEAVMIEQLGDGRVRVHMLEGKGIGGGVSGDDIFGSPISFGVSAIDGVTNDKTYEFTSLADAQEWISWQKRWDAVGDGDGCTSSAQVNSVATCIGGSDHSDEYDELAEEEPDHHVVNDANAETKTVTVNVGIDGQKGGDSKDKKSVGVGGEAEGSYSGEVMVEDRLWDNGLYEVSYTSTDIGGFLVSAGLGPGGPWGKSDKLGKLMGKGGVGAEWKGSTKTTVYFDPSKDEDEDGKADIVQMYITIDDQALTTLYQAGIDVETDLPYGFTAGGGWGKNKKEGKSSVQEFILDFNQYPGLRDKFEPMVDELFPRDEDGLLKKGDIEIDRNDQEDGGDLREELEDSGNVRELTYEDVKTEEFGEAGIGWEGIDLIGADWNVIDEERVLQESSFEVTDADGNKVKITPAPRCKHEKFEPDDDYYTNGEEKTGPGTSFADPKYTDDDESPYPGTGFDGDVPGKRGEKSKSLATEYGKAFPDKNIVVLHKNIAGRGEFGPDVKGLEYLAHVGDFYVVGLDSGTFTRGGDGGFINWSFYGNYNRPGDKVVKFEPRG